MGMIHRKEHPGEASLMSKRWGGVGDGRWGGVGEERAWRCVKNENESAGKRRNRAIFT